MTKELDDFKISTLIARESAKSALKDGVYAEVEMGAMSDEVLQIVETVRAAYQQLDVAVDELQQAVDRGE
jgi:hypothetical protein